MSHAPQTTRRAAASPCSRPCEIDQAVEPIGLTNKPEFRPGQLVDRYGHTHSEAIFKQLVARRDLGRSASVA